MARIASERVGIKVKITCDCMENQACRLAKVLQTARCGTGDRFPCSPGRDARREQRKEGIVFQEFFMKGNTADGP